MKTFEGQNLLPKLPVPPLDQTLQKYLDTVRPFLDEEQFLKTVALVEEFKCSMGPKLQERLLEREKYCAQLDGWNPQYVDGSSSTANDTINSSVSSPAVKKNHLGEIVPTRCSWLIDWWNQYSYLRYREPVVLNVSFFYVFPISYGSMISRAAQIIFHGAQFRNLVVNEELEPALVKDKPLCMQQYKFLFNTCRVPAVPADFVRSFDPNKNRHIVVIRNNHYYSFEVIDSAGQVLSVADIERNVLWIISDADKRSANVSVGMLTAAHRDLWTKHYEYLSKSNSSFIRKIESSMFVVCLDTSTPVTREEMAHLCWHGYGNNRWFDKTLQFIVFQNGRAGFLGEHSMMDATTPAHLCDYICSKENSSQRVSTSLANIQSMKQCPEYLPVKLDGKLKAAVEETRLSLHNEIEKHDVQCVNFTRYGKGFIKRQSMSPDSFVQMAIQLAYFRLMGTFVATYESAGMRRYQWGRTETCRSVSSASVQFCKSMENLDTSLAERQTLARQAIQTHSQYMSSCLAGNGIDRHFLGLRLCLEADEPMPAIFLDPVYKLSCHWTLSTSQIPTEYFEGYGWGEVVPDGFGVAYMVREDRIMFNVAGLVGSAVPELEQHFSYDKVVDTTHMQTAGLRDLNSAKTWAARDTHTSYFAARYKHMRVKWFKTCLEEALDDLYELFNQTDGKDVAAAVVAPAAQNATAAPIKAPITSVSESLRMTSTDQQVPGQAANTASPLVSVRTPSVKSLPSSSNLGLSLAYPNRNSDEYLDGVVGEDVGMIEFEIGWGEQRQKDTAGETHSYSRRKRLVKMFWPWGAAVTSASDTNGNSKKA